MNWSTVRQIRKAALMLLCGGLLAACTPELPLQPAAQNGQLPTALPASYYLQAEAQGRKILRVDSRQSLVVLEVRRAGPFARLGHDHVVASHDVTGFVSPEDGRADLALPLDKLVVDEAALRSAAGFDTQPTPDDIAGTRRNMLTKVLEAQRFPLALIHVTRKGADESAGPVLNVAITLHGVTRSFAVPAAIQPAGDGIIVSGKMHFRQSDFGIVPFSILNGAIRVRDELDLRFRIVATDGRAQ